MELLLKCYSVGEVFIVSPSHYRMAVNKIEGSEIAKEETKRFLGQTGFLMNKSQVKAPLYHELVNTECPKLKEAMMTLAKKSKGVYWALHH